jgi:hypothetical protein
MTHSEPNHESATAALDLLADELIAHGYEARIVIPGHQPSLAVRNPQAPALAENVVVAAEWFWWSWAERIAAVADVADAARRVARVLAAGTVHE